MLPKLAGAQVYGYDKRNGRDAAWDSVQRHEMIATFAWPAMQQSPGMHFLPAEVKDYFSAATDAAEAAPATTSASKCTAGYKLRSKGKGTKQDQDRLSRNKNEKGPTRPPGYSNKRPK